MANLRLKPGTNVPKLKKELKKRGFILRKYKQPDGTHRYSLLRNTYLPPEALENLNDLKELLGL